LRQGWVKKSPPPSPPLIPSRLVSTRTHAPLPCCSQLARRSRPPLAPLSPPQENIGAVAHGLISRGCGVNDRDSITDMAMLHFACTFACCFLAAFGFLSLFRFRTMSIDGARIRLDLKASHSLTFHTSSGTALVQAKQERVDSRTSRRWRGLWRICSLQVRMQTQCASGQR
jgi:hypothetical protein